MDAPSCFAQDECDELLVISRLNSDMIPNERFSSLHHLSVFHVPSLLAT